MRPGRPLPVLLFFAALAFSGARASAAVLWNWSFGTESGTFTTDGTFADTAGAHSFVITDFQVQASATPANVGALYIQEQPVDGMIWDGSAPTEFSRDSGGLTNGANFTNSANNFRYVLFPGTSLLENQNEVTVASGDLTVTPVGDVAATGLPTLGVLGRALLALSLAAAGVSALQLLRR